jgi:anti-sigma factor RsiW
MANREHDLQWGERLQDWLDGDSTNSTASEHAAFAKHLATCIECQNQIESFARLDANLTATLVAPALNAKFDERLLAQIQNINESQRAAARLRIKQEFDTSLQLLTQRRRRAWQLLIPGMIGGLAVALAVSAWLDTSHLTQLIVDGGVNEFGHGAANAVRLGLLTLIGAAIGLGLARWLAPAD